VSRLLDEKLLLYCFTIQKCSGLGLRLARCRAQPNPLEHRERPNKIKLTRLCQTKHLTRAPLSGTHHSTKPNRYPLIRGTVWPRTMSTNSSSLLPRRSPDSHPLHADNPTHNGDLCATLEQYINPPLHEGQIFHSLRLLTCTSYSELTWVSEHLQVHPLCWLLNLLTCLLGQHFLAP
jgi:hypothetical protein